MSTKWNNNQKMQKTPKICKKGPPELPEDEQQYRYYDLQAEADWTDEHTPLEQAIAGMTTLTPYPGTNVHTGAIRATRASLILHLEWFPLASYHVYTISLFINEIFQDSVSVTFTEPKDVLPFAAGLFTWQPPPGTKTVHSKIYS